jgi:hypothetical protein
MPGDAEVVVVDGANHEGHVTAAPRLALLRSRHAPRSAGAESALVP